MNQTLNVVSLFDGISCGRAALDRAGIAVNRYAAFEIDKYAKAVSRYNYLDIVQHGDVLDADFSRFEGYDLVMGGSPCTFWSIAKANREVDKSGIGWRLFTRFVESVRIIRPRYFLYENVTSMPQSIKEYITEELGVEPVSINSALVSAQRRKRLYWTNIKGIEQPKDKGILLKDILESGVNYCDKAYAITASYNGAIIENSLSRKQRTMVFEPVALADKSQTILATLYKENALSMVIRGKTGLFCAQEVALDTLTTTRTDSIIRSPVRGGSYKSGGQGNRIYSVHGKVVSLMANGGRSGKIGKINLPDGDYIIRKLTPKEAERCQTLPDDYTAFGIDDSGKTVPISNTQRYKSIGNGWTVDIIAHILGHIVGGDEYA